MVTRVLCAALSLLSIGCFADPNKASKTLLIPEEMKKRPTASTRAASSASKDGGERDRYVLRITEGTRTYEMILPDQAGGYQVAVPLELRGKVVEYSEADEELIRDMDREKLAKSGEDPAKADPNSDIGARIDARRGSYLGGLARVNEMYASRKFELALIELVRLERGYPNDARILAMKGSLYLKLGKNKLARDAWEKALVQNPDDESVADALRNLASIME